MTALGRWGQRGRGEDETKGGLEGVGNGQGDSEANLPNDMNMEVEVAKKRNRMSLCEHYATTIFSEIGPFERNRF